MYEILTPGQKLKMLRKELHLTQTQLSSPSISREFISMVEHDLRRLSHENALSLMEQIKQIAEIQKIPFNYPPDYLNITSDQEFLRFVKALDMSSSTVESLEELYDHSIETNQLESQGVLLKGLAKKYIYSNFNRSFLYYTNAKEIFIALEDAPEVRNINNNLGGLCQIHNKLNEAAVYLEMALHSNNNSLQERDRYSITLNLALVYSKLEMHNKCLELLDKPLEDDYLKSLTNDKVNILILRAVSLAETDNLSDALSLIEQLEKYDEAENEYLKSNKIFILRKINLESAIAEQHKLLDATTDPDLKVQNLSLLGELYFDNNMLSTSLYYYQLAVNEFTEETYPELQMNIFDRIIRSHLALGSLTRDILNEVIHFCQRHQFNDSLMKYGLMYLNLSESLSEDDSRILTILNTLLPL